MSHANRCMGYMGYKFRIPVTHVSHVQPMEDESKVIDMFKTKESETK